MEYSRNNFSATPERRNIGQADRGQHEKGVHNTLASSVRRLIAGVNVLFYFTPMPIKYQDAEPPTLLPPSYTHTHTLTHFHHGSPVQQDNIHQNVNLFACNLSLKVRRHITDIVQQSIYKHITHGANTIDSVKGDKLKGDSEISCVIKLLRSNR
jgi:hypothetical protein